MTKRGIVLSVALAIPLIAQNDFPGSITVGGGINPVTLTANGSDTYVGALPKAIGSYQARVCYTFTPDVDNVGPASLKLGDLDAKSLVRQDGSALSNSDYRANQPYLVCYSQTNDNLVGIGVGATASSGGGGGDPGGSSCQLQFNNNGTFAGVTGTCASGSRITIGGKLDIGSGSFRPPVGTTLPITCETGDQFFKSDAPAGRNTYGCIAGVWVQQGDGAGDTSVSGCATGPGIHIPPVGGPRCAKGTATNPFAWGGLDFPNPATAGTTCINLGPEHVPTGWNGSAPDFQMTVSRPDGTFSAGNKYLFSLKTWFVAEQAVVGGNATFSEPSWNTETLNDVSPTGSDPLDVDKRQTSTIRALELGSSPNHAQAKGKMMMQLCRQASGAGGRTDSLAASIRVLEGTLRWGVGTRVTTTVGTTGAGTSVSVVNGAGSVSSASQRILILGAGAAGANYTGTISSTSAGTFPAHTFTISPATSTSVPAGTLVAFEASLADRTFYFTGTGPEASQASGAEPAGAALYDDPRQWTATNGTSCSIVGVNLPASASTACVTNSGTDPESGIQYPDNSASTNYVTLRTKAPPNWDETTAPTLFLTALQVGSGTGNILMSVGTWSIAEGATYTSPSYTTVNCTAAAGPGDAKKVSIVCPNLSITGAGSGRAIKLKISRVGADASDTLSVPIRIFESALRWTVTSACPAP